MSAIQKVVGKDPIAQKVMKVDPLARQFAMDHGLVAERQTGGQPAAAAPAAPEMPAPPRAAPWQEERMAALRVRFGRPRAPAAAAPAVQPPGGGQMAGGDAFGSVTAARPVASGARPPADGPSAALARMFGGAVSAPIPAQPSGVKSAMPVTTKPITSAQPGTMADSPIVAQPANPAAADMAAYKNAWQSLA
jgi:hypothetical protein